MAAWPPMGRYSYSTGGKRLSVWFAGRSIVAEAQAACSPGAGLRAPQGRAGPLAAQAHFLPAGMVLEHPADRSASTRLTIPLAVAVAVAGLPWRGILLIRGGGLASATREEVDRAEHAGTPSEEDGAGTLRRRPLGWAWRLRCATGSAALVAAWWCIHTMPRDSAGVFLLEAQALHIAAASWGVALATMLITFD